MNNTEPVPTIDSILDDLMQYSYDYGAKKIPSSENPPIIKARQAKAQLERICASERLDELNMISCRYGVFVDSTLGYEVKTKAVSLKDIGERAKVLQTQLEGETK